VASKEKRRGKRSSPYFNVKRKGEKDRRGGSIPFEKGLKSQHRQGGKEKKRRKKRVPASLRRERISRT